MSGDARLDLWEALCTCGGALKSPDVRMCQCLATAKAGLNCQQCGLGVLLIKTSATGKTFCWGCSLFKKAACHFTSPFGPPHDRQAAQALEWIRASGERQLEEEALIIDVHEMEWRSHCTCGGAKNLNTFECFMQSEGGCGFLPICPACGDGLFLKEGIKGKYWRCRRLAMCGFSKTYEPPKSQQEQHVKKPKSTTTAPEVDSTPRHLQDASNSHATVSAGKIPVISPLITPEQKAMIEAKRQAALVKVKRTLERGAAGATIVSEARGAYPQSPVPSSLKTALSPELKTMIEAKRQAALAKVKRTLEGGAAGATSVSQMPDMYPQSPVPSPLKTALSPELKTMIEAKRQAALAKVKRTLEGGADEATSVSQMPDMYPQSPVPSSRKTPRTPERNTMIEAKRQAALAKVKRALEGGVLAAGATIVSQMPVIYPQSPAPSSQKTPLTPEQKTMIEAKRQVALAKVKE
jgi:ssDNA-binding Zn-finger/Zn-ribbon topoisomerase 1